MSHTRVNKIALLRAAITASLGAVALLVGTAAQAGNPKVGVSINVSQPGFYGRIDLGDQPPPALIYPQPVIIQQAPITMYQRPIYLRVPEDHHRNWARYCSYYRACGQPVYFVREMERRADDRERAHREWEHRERDERRERYERRDEREDRHGRGDDGHDRGRGHGNGNGRGHDHRD